MIHSVRWPLSRGPELLGWRSRQAWLVSGEVVRKVPRRRDDAAVAGGYGGRLSTSHRPSQLDPVSGGPAQSDTAYARCAWNDGSVCLQGAKPAGGGPRYGWPAVGEQGGEAVGWGRRRPGAGLGRGSGQGQGTQRMELVNVCLCACVVSLDGGRGRGLSIHPRA